MSFSSIIKKVNSIASAVSGINAKVQTLDTAALQSQLQTVSDKLKALDVPEAMADLDKISARVEQLNVQAVSRDLSVLSDTVSSPWVRVWAVAVLVLLIVMVLSQGAVLVRLFLQ